MSSLPDHWPKCTTCNSPLTFEKRGDTGVLPEEKSGWVCDKCSLYYRVYREEDGVNLSEPLLPPGGKQGRAAIQEGLSKSRFKRFLKYLEGQDEREKYRKAKVEEKKRMIREWKEKVKKAGSF